MIDVDETLGRLAKQYSSATMVFMRHRLNIYGRRRRSLRQVCAECGVNPAVVAAELAVRHQQESRQDSDIRDPRPTPFPRASDRGIDDIARRCLDR